MKHTFCIIGQSNYAVAIILDTLAAVYPGAQMEVDIIANIPDAANDSLEYPFDFPGILSKRLFYKDWQPKADYSAYFVGSIGKSRRAILSFFQKEFVLPSTLFPLLVHPSSVCSPTMQVGHGGQINPLCVVAPYATLGDFVVLNRQVSIGHHTVLEDFVTLNPGAHIAGCCRVASGVTIGAGATVVDKITIGKNSIIGAGSVVTRPIPEGVIAFGSPAKIIREIEVL